MTVQNQQKKMNAHKEFVAKSVERRDMHEEHIKKLRIDEEKKWEILKVKQ